jgi:hypothetical protein
VAIDGTGMKIEIGEFLILSWLRHVRGCVVTQMNWSPSPAWTVARERELRATFEAARSFADDTIGRSSFGQVDFESFVRHASIDVLGLRVDRDGGTEAIAVDSAINDTELPHGNAEETIVRLIQRMTRAAFALAAFLEPRQASVVFATPWLATAVRQEVQRHLALLEQRLAQQRGPGMAHLRFRVIADGDFADEIVQPVMEHVGAVADTSGLVGQPQRSTRLGGTANGSTRRGSDRPLKPTGNAGSRIGEHVRRTMNELAASGRLTARIVGDLLDPHYCKARFNLRHPFLKPIDQNVPISTQRMDRNGNGRYWKVPLKIGGHEFLMCSQWFVRQRDAFDAWVRDLG